MFGLDFLVYQSGFHHYVVVTIKMTRLEKVLFVRAIE